MIVIEAKKWEHPFTCTGCGSVLIALADDMRHGDFGHQGDHDYRYYCVCPICGENELLEARVTLPPKVHMLAMDWANTAAAPADRGAQS